MKNKSNNTIIISVGIVILVVVVFLVLQRVQTEIPGVEKIVTMGNRHIDTIDAEHEPYNSNPPTSGPHVGSIAPWGVSSEIIPDEQQIHNLEDGGVVVQYNPDVLPKTEWNVLEDAVMSAGRTHVIIAPRYDMEYVIALTAWNKLLPLDIVDIEKVQQFIKAYEGIDHHL
ncbi:MAG: hypothetical protein CO029_02490 [Candidatus Magasanikbacteria bacterium CG_4_9_14_0_2_um_filter_41_10]|uniref:DUF3105 domain-containing protein n=1 Tax=Candidatus Magasanikbacteria bacterium CG_4_10_14_0_2_um_filter_41_31 TaxID=1974639 RepID=A0A2M7V4A5_9BACT|nr:MAG: hypothetical protein AUJ37_00275 [Candidatus Magasanikbacteria bacterium CG1_02_41_34]PIZ93376.1 MAG: hypothetical protein COX83_02170 [Candidatus Magasanikbacteria bacterium CG_4_10_14_0_2_um_filter_41_31]PJC53492.1 MAG: hypothetical protein CO029_02490 [Candidatus Magasanikbacteria bacterium CG_4_9_14_0_2_um_filter_41_10]